MNKYFLTGCAAAALVMVAGVASAQDFKVTIAGDAKSQAMFIGQDKNSNSRSVDFRNRFRFTVNPEATALNGALTYGAMTRVQTNNPNGQGTLGYEYTFVYASGAFGKVYFGDMASFNDDCCAVKRPAGYQSEDGIGMDMASASKATEWTAADNMKLMAGQPGAINLGGQATRIRYDSPFISGFKFGVSYTPSSGSDGWDISRSKTTSVQDAYEIGLFFDSTDKSIADRFGGATVKASFAYQGAKNGNTLRKDFQYLQAGLNVGYAGFTVGGGYSYAGQSDLAKSDVQKTNQYGYGIGAQYVTGPWTAGVGYTYLQMDSDFTGATQGKKTSKVFSAGVMYNVAKGLDVSIDYAHVNAKNTFSTYSDSANVVTLTTAIGF